MIFFFINSFERLELLQHFSFGFQVQPLSRRRFLAPWGPYKKYAPAAAAAAATRPSPTPTATFVFVVFLFAICFFRACLLKKLLFSRNSNLTSDLSFLL